MRVRLRHVALHYDLIALFLYEHREMSSKRHAVDIRNQNGERICSHESKGSSAVFLAIEFGYVQFLGSPSCRAAKKPVDNGSCLLERSTSGREHRGRFCCENSPA